MVTDRYTIQLTIAGNDKASDDLRKVNRELDDLDGNSRRASTGIDGLATAAKGFIAAGLAQFASQAVGELRQLGSQSVRAETTFEALAGGTAQAEIGLQQLRAATGGVVDDLTLLEGANSLLLTGLAQSTSEAAELQRIAVTLGGSLGRAPAESIEQLNAALLNNSFERLDSLGISAAAVRERVAELKDEGLDMSEAFAQATIEQGVQAIDRLGDAADASRTATALLTTQFDNARIKAGEYANSLAETVSQLVLLSNIAAGNDGFGTIDPIAQATRENIASSGLGSVQNFTVSQARDFQANNPELFDRLATGDTFANFARGQGQGAFDGSTFTAPNVLTEEITAVLESFGVDVANTTREGLLVYAAELDTLLSAYDSALGDVETPDTDEFLSLDEVRANRLEREQQEAQALQNQANAFSQLDALEQQSLANSQAQLENVQQANAERLEQQALAETYLDLERQTNDLQSQNLEGLRSFIDANSSSVGGVALFDPDAVDEVIARANELENQVTALENLQLFSDGLEIVTDDDIENARQLAEQGRLLAEDAQRAAEAVENLSLSQLFNQQDAGALGEITDAVAETIRATQGDDAANEFLDQANNQIGRETATSDAFRDEFTAIFAAIADELGIEQAVAAQERFLAATEQGRIDGLTEEQILANQRQAVNFELVGGGEQQQIGVQAGDTLSQLALENDVSVDELIEANGGSNFIRPGDVITLGDGQRLVAIDQSQLANGGQGTNDPFASILNPIGSGQFADSELPATGTEDSFTEEQATNSTTIADNVTAIAEQGETISTTLDGFNTDLQDAGTYITDVEGRLANIGSMGFSADLELNLLLNDQSGLALDARILQQIQVYFDNGGAPQNVPVGVN